jgi:hypothetical protein
VNAYYGSGCYSCGGWAAAGAAAAGLVAGASLDAATANAYAAGVGAGSAYAIGAIYPTLPSGCIISGVGDSTYYHCGASWFRPSFGANGVYYRCVPVPSLY